MRSFRLLERQITPQRCRCFLPSNILIDQITEHFLARELWRHKSDAERGAVIGKVAVDFELQPLSAINDVFQHLEHGKAPSRVVLDFAGG